MTTIGFIGGGQIATALATGFIAAGFCKSGDLAVFDRQPDHASTFAVRTGARISPSTTDLAATSKVLFLCVKPGDVESALAPVRSKLDPEKLLVSVAAGISLAQLDEATGGHKKICRAMPNTAAEVRLAATALCFSEGVSVEEQEFLRDAFNAVGEAFFIQESLFDAVVGVSGSGPAYAFLLIEAMAEGATAAGLPRSTALRLAALAVRGAAELVVETNRHPALLREMVSSPGGTTLAGLQQLEEGAVRAHVARAVRAAAQRSAELSAR
jgi:pyrroline-5-carboxylate reductase